MEPVLTKLGCNSGACHGAAAGKNGFRLTLRGYGPEVDHAVLTRQALGRRIVKTAPQESLLLLKPTGAIEHGGRRPVRDRLARVPGDRRVDRRRHARPSAARPGDQVARRSIPTAVRLEPGQSSKSSSRPSTPTVASRT